MSPTSCFWTKPASPPICFGGTAGHRVARASTTTPPAGAGRPARFSPRCGLQGRRHRGSSMARSMARASAPTSIRSWLPILQPGYIRDQSDNLGCPQGGARRDRLRRAGPPETHSGTCHRTARDLNPIELCFAKLKALVRTTRCRSTKTLWQFLDLCLAHFSPNECRTTNTRRSRVTSAATRSCKAL